MTKLFIVDKTPTSLSCKLLLTAVSTKLVLKDRSHT